MRVLLDAQLSPQRIGRPLGRRGHDVRALASEPKLEGFADQLVLELATAERRVLVTRNSRDFTPITRAWAEAGREHAGVVLIWSFSPRQFSDIVAAVDECLDRHDERSWLGRVLSI